MTRRFTRVVCFDLNLRGPYKDGKTLVKKPEGLRTCLPSSIFLILRTSTGDLSSVLAPMLLHRLHLLYDGSKSPPPPTVKTNTTTNPCLPTCCCWPGGPGQRVKDRSGILLAALLTGGDPQLWMCSCAALHTLMRSCCDGTARGRAVFFRLRVEDGGIVGWRKEGETSERRPIKAGRRGRKDGGEERSVAA